jgi:3-deoxy-D-manno-octulosonic-acid transferase
LLVTLPYWVVRIAFQRKYRAGLWQKLGFVPEHARMRNDERVIWLHAVSVGEVLAVSGLVEQLRLAFPQHRVMVSTTTATGQKLARTRFGQENVFYFPLDLPFAVQSYLRALRPQVIVLAETEFWPNFIRLCHKSGARIAVVNGRISDRSYPGYMRWRSVMKKILGNVNLFLTQSEVDRQRLLAIGVDPQKIRVSGNLKFDVPAPAELPITTNLRPAFSEASAAPVIVAGSTVVGEELLLLNAFRNLLASHANAVMVLAPRNPERFEAVARAVQNFGVRFWRRSLWKGEPLSGGVFLLDSIGELGTVYSLADIAFVGGSLAPRGGHNIIEPAKHGVPIVVGTHMENFRDIIDLFNTKNGVRMVGVAELPLVFLELAGNASERAALGQRGSQVVQSQIGATARTVDALKTLIRKS